MILGITVNAYAVREYAQRYPTGTAIEVYTPNNPPTLVETDPTVNTSAEIQAILGDIYLFNSGDTSTGALTINNNDGVDDEVMLTIGDSNDLDSLVVYGKIGVGTAVPVFPLHIIGVNGSAVSAMIQSDAGDDSSLRYRNGSNSKWAIGNDATDDSYIISTGTDLSIPKLSVLQTGEVKITDELLVGSDANLTDFPLAKFISSAGNTGHTYTGNIGTIGEANASSTDTGTGVGGVAKTNGANQGRGVAGVGKVSATGDGGASIGGYFRAEDTHAGGRNIGCYAFATGGLYNNALYLAGGDIYTPQSQSWTLYDNYANALRFNSAGKNDILNIDTTDSAEKVTMSGGLTVTGNINNTALTASKVVFTDASKNLTSTGIGTSSQFIKGDGSLDSATYLTSEVDGSITNELPIAGNLIDISGTPVSTVDVDLTEAGDLTWGSGSASTMVHTYNLSGTDVTVTFGSNSVTFSGDLHVTGDLYVNDIFIDNYLATALTVGANGVGGTEGIITLDNGDNPGTTATLSFTKWADLEAVNGLVKSNGSGDYSAITDNSTNWDKYNQWDGGSTGLTSATGRDSLLLRGFNSAYTSDNAVYIQATTGNVGIGTTSPNQLLTVENSISLKEIASANADTAAYGQIWVKNTTPNQLWFTDDAGTDVQLGTGGTTASKSFIITNPTSSADGALWKTPEGITITAVHGVQVGGTNIIGHLTECDADGLNPAGVDGATDMTITTSNVNDDGSLSNASIDSGDYVGWRTTSVSGTVTKAIITFDYQKT